MYGLIGTLEPLASRMPPTRATSAKSTLNSTEQLLSLTLGFYQEAKAAKAYDKVDQIRAALKEQGIVIKDTKTGVEWAYSED